MAAVVQNFAESSHPLVWFRNFLKEELASYPGRAHLVARMVIAATLIMLITMTFRIPYGVIGGLITLLISRESPQTTVMAVRRQGIVYVFAGAYVLLGALFALGDPILRLLWVIGTLFLVFYAISAMADFASANSFGFLILLTIPLWDMHIPAELKVENTLWVILQTFMACGIVLLVELMFAELSPRDDLIRSIAERLASVEELLGCYIANQPVDEQTEKKITRLGMLGTSRLRRILQRSIYSQHYREQMGAIVVLVGRLVDIAANLTYLSTRVSDDNRKRMRSLAESIAGIRTDLLSGRCPCPIEFPSESEALHAIPLLREMEGTVSLISHVFTGSQSLSAYAPPPPGDPPSRIFVPDALSNSGHIKFGLKGCLAASLCYIIYTSVDWQSISVAMVTSLLIAVTTVGASHQNQLLRITGTFAGGVLVGIGAQVFILPYIDSIFGFTLLFVVVTIAAAWIATSGPRLSYFGIQFALAFYFINLQEFRMQTSLAVARDRVVGILLGLFMMWLVFDHLWGVPAAVGMKRAFISTLRSLAQLAREPLSKDIRVAIERSHSLRETINSSFDRVRGQADGVLFEFGSSRHHDLALRRQIVRWHTQLRMIFVMRITLLKYRFQLPGFELPEAICVAQQEFDDRLAEMLEGMADRIEGKAPEGKVNLEDSFERLEREIRTCCLEEPQEALAAQLQTFLALSRRIESLTISLDKEI
jgi:multidrug resistance protein MdtO